MLVSEPITGELGAADHPWYEFGAIDCENGKAAVQRMQAFYASIGKPAKYTAAVAAIQAAYDKAAPYVEGVLNSAACRAVRNIGDQADDLTAQMGRDAGIATPSERSSWGWLWYVGGAVAIVGVSWYGYRALRGGLYGQLARRVGLGATAPGALPATYHGWSAQAVARQRSLYGRDWAPWPEGAGPYDRGRSRAINLERARGEDVAAWLQKIGLVSTALSHQAEQSPAMDLLRAAIVREGASSTVHTNAGVIYAGKKRLGTVEGFRRAVERAR